MKTIKIIDLLNKIANGEELPKKIKYNNIIFSIRKDMEDYVSEDESWFTDCFSLLDLNDEAEIIEDELIHFSEEENQALKNIIKKNSVPLKDNFFDYYEDTPVKRNKCEWCEERRYTLIGNEEIGTLYCMNLDEDNNGYLIEILRQKPPKAIWERRYIKHISYCPFCGRKLEK